MKRLVKNLGFTMLELVIAIGLLGVVSIGTGAYLSNSFKDSNKLASKAEVQSSVTALMNKIETAIKTADVPVFDGEITGTEFKITQIKEKNKVTLTFKHDTDDKKVKAKEGLLSSTTYENIEKITINPINNTEGQAIGAAISIEGEGKQYSLSATYYTRNMMNSVKANNYDGEEEASKRVVTIEYDATTTDGLGVINLLSTQYYSLLENETEALVVVSEDKNDGNKLKEPERYGGYIFDCWQDEEGNKYKAGDEWLVPFVEGGDNIHKLTALWARPKVGDYITYYPNQSYTVVEDVSGTADPQTFNTSLATNWKVFSVEEDGPIQLISASSVEELTLKGKVGYVNGVQTLNNLSQAYINPALASSARSLGYSESGLSGTNLTNYRVINTTTYPILHKVDSVVNDVTGFPYNDIQSNSDKAILNANPLLHTNEDVWLASRYAESSTAKASFVLKAMNINSSKQVEFKLKDLVKSTFNIPLAYSRSYGVRPIITLRDDILLRGKNGTQDSPYVVNGNSNRVAVVYHSNGGSGNMATQIVDKGDSVTLTANNFSRNSHIFVGWSTIQNGSITYNNKSKINSLNNNIMLYAQWQEIYTIKYDANGGTGTMDEQTLVAGDSVTLSENKFTRDNYVFQGWSTSKTGAVEYAVGMTIIPTDNMTLYAIWSPVMKTGSTWFDTTDAGGYGRDRYLELIILDEFDDRYYDESFLVDASGNGDIMCYLDVSSDNVCIIAGNGSGKIYANPDSSNMFKDFSTIGNIQGLDILDTSLVTNMEYMFSDCSALTSLDVSRFNTSLVANMGAMFNGCSALTSLDVSKFNTSLVTNMSNMFCGCHGLTSLDVSEFDTSKVTTMHQMFVCNKLTSLDLSNFNTEKVTDMSNMFCDAQSITSIKLSSNFKTSNVTHVNGMHGMFARCYELQEIDVSMFDTSNVYSMRFMFLDCRNLKKLDLRNFNTKNTTLMADMFVGMSSLEKITLGVDFTFEGNGTERCVLPTPAIEYWYNMSCEKFLPIDVPNGAGTYYAFEPLAIAAKAGEYVSYLPTEDNCVVSVANLQGQIGFKSNPSETVLWKVFDIKDKQVELISPESVGSISLYSKGAYISVVQKLLDISNAYVNPDYAINGRPLGYSETGLSDEDIKNYRKLDTNTYPVKSGVSPEFPYVVEQYSDDEKILNDNPSLLQSSGTAIIAARYASGSKFYTCYYLNSSGVISKSGYFTVDKSGNTSSVYKMTIGVRPIVVLKTEIFVTSGSGTSNDPYILMVGGDYELKYDLNGGSGSLETQSNSNNTFTITTVKPRKYGYKFVGWSTNSDAETVEYIAGDSITIQNKTQTLYAVWEEGLLLADEVEPGDYIKYSSSQDWYVLKNEAGVVDIITTASVKTLTFKGKDGYNSYNSTLLAVSEGYKNSYAESSRIVTGSDVNQMRDYGLSGETIFINGKRIDSNGANASTNAGIATYEKYIVYTSTGEERVHTTTYNSDGSVRANTQSEATAGVRPVITLISDLEVTGGSGTADDPYIIE